MADEETPPKMAREEMEKLLRDTPAPWQRDGGGIRGIRPPTTGSAPPEEVPGGRWPVKVEQSAETPPFPAIEPPQQVTEESEESVTATNEFSFELELDQINKEANTVGIHVGYGEINDTPPDGMTGADDYILTITDDGTEIYAVITYDPDTLEITSRTLGFGVSVPDSSLGTLCVPIGFVDFEVDGDGKITAVFPHNRHCGDIRFALVFADINAAPALVPVAVLGDIVPVT